MKILLVIPFSILFSLSCSDNSSPISNQARSNIQVGNKEVELRTVDSTEIGNGRTVADSTDIGNGQTAGVENDSYDLVCAESEISVGRFSCEIVGSEGEPIIDADWSVSCAVNNLGHPEGDQLRISFESEADDCEVTVILEDTDKQKKVKKKKAKAEDSEEDSTGVLASDKKDAGKKDKKEKEEQEEEPQDLILASHVLSPVEGGIEGDFDIAAYNYDCLEGEECPVLAKHVAKYDDLAGKNGIDLIEPKIASEDLRLKLTGDFCILALNTQMSKEAVITINTSGIMATQLYDIWEPNCPSYHLVEGSSTLSQMLHKFEVSFPVDALSLEGGLGVSSDNALVIRFVDATTGAILMDYNIFHNDEEPVEDPVEEDVIDPNADGSESDADDSADGADTGDPATDDTTTTTDDSTDSTGDTTGEGGAVPPVDGANAVIDGESPESAES